jgi:hypothetical protein
MVWEEPTCQRFAVDVWRLGVPKNFTFVEDHEPANVPTAPPINPIWFILIGGSISVVAVSFAVAIFVHMRIRRTYLTA